MLCVGNSGRLYRPAHCIAHRWKTPVCRNVSCCCLLYTLKGSLGGGWLGIERMRMGLERLPEPGVLDFAAVGSGEPTRPVALFPHCCPLGCLCLPRWGTCGGFLCPSWQNLTDEQVNVTGGKSPTMFNGAPRMEKNRDHSYRARLWHTRLSQAPSAGMEGGSRHRLSGLCFHRWESAKRKGDLSREG